MESNTPLATGDTVKDVAALVRLLIESNNTKRTAPPTLALRPAAAAKAIGIGKRKLWEITNDGQIPHAKIGVCVVYPVGLLQDWLAEQAAKGVKS